MKTKEENKNFRAKSSKSLYLELMKTHEQLQKLQFSSRVNKVKDISKLKKIKHSIARINTILREKLIKK